MEDFRYRIRKGNLDAHVAVLDAEGALDSYTSEKLQEALKQLFDAGTYHVVLNLQGLKYMSSAGIGLIVEQMEVARAHNGDIKLAQVSAKIEKVLDICGATKLIQLFKEEDTAVKQFSQRTVVQEAIEFPRDVKCPACGQVSRVSSPDIYKCGKCSEVCYVDPKGTVSALKQMPMEGGEPKAITRKVELNIQSDLSFIQSIKLFLKDLLMKDGFDEEVSSDIELAVDEALTNVVEHAYQFDDSRFFGMTILLQEDRLTVTVTDFGKSHAPRDAATEEVVDDFTKRLRRGRGKLLIKKLGQPLD